MSQPPNKSNVWRDAVPGAFRCSTVCKGWLSDRLINHGSASQQVPPKAAKLIICSSSIRVIRAALPLILQCTPLLCNPAFTCTASGVIQLFHDGGLISRPILIIRTTISPCTPFSDPALHSLNTVPYLGRVHSFSNTVFSLFPRYPVTATTLQSWQLAFSISSSAWQPCCYCWGWFTNMIRSSIPSSLGRVSRTKLQPAQQVYQAHQQGANIALFSPRAEFAKLTYVP